MWYVEYAYSTNAINEIVVEGPFDTEGEAEDFAMTLPIKSSPNVFFENGD